MIEISYHDRYGHHARVLVDSVKIWEARGGGREHPDGTVIEGWRGGTGVVQLDTDDRVGTVLISEVSG